MQPIAQESRGDGEDQSDGGILPPATKAGSCVAAIKFGEATVTTVSGAVNG
jgi:hypothetical protein